MFIRPRNALVSDLLMGSASMGPASEDVYTYNDIEVDPIEADPINKSLNSRRKYLLRENLMASPRTCGPIR